MTAYQEFLDKMDAILGKFPGRLEELRQLGTEPEGMVLRREGCFAITFQHPDEFNQQVATYSQAVANAVPAFVYGTDRVQTTVTPYQLIDNFMGQADDPALDILRRSVEYALEDVPFSSLAERQIHFKGWIYSRGVVLAPGWPNEEQFMLIQAILAGCRRAGFEPKGPWGSHCNVNRFTATVSPEGCQELYQLIDEAPALDYLSINPAIRVLGNVADGQSEFTTTYKVYQP